MNVVDLLDIDDSKEDVYSIASSLSEAFQAGDVSQLCLSKSPIPFNRNGPLLTLSFGSLFDASYRSPYPESIFFYMTFPYGVVRKRPFLYELASSDVARELQILFSDTSSLANSNASALSEKKAHLKQFPSLAGSHCVILTWFDATDAPMFQTGCVVSHGNPVTTSDYLLYFAREGLKQLQENASKIRCTVTIVADILFPSKWNSFIKRLREIRLPPMEQMVRSMERGDAYQKDTSEGEERVLFVSSPIRSLADVESQVRVGVHGLYLVRPGKEVRWVTPSQMQSSHWSLVDALEALCGDKERQCWRYTQNGLFVFRSTEYSVRIDAV